MPDSRRKNKYGVAPKEDRTLDGIAYASKAEMIRASELKLLARAGWTIEEQVWVRLTPDDRYRLDFFVIDTEDRKHWEDVKGHETREFKRLRRLWSKYGPGTLVVLKRRNAKWEREILHGPQDVSARRCF